jgi:hypothetical protein
VKTCPTCGAAFTPTHRVQRYCGPGCRKPFGPEYYRRRYLVRLGRPLKPRGAKPDLAKRARVRELREAGLTIARIAAELGVTPQAVQKLLAKMNADRPPLATG